MGGASGAQHASVDKKAIGGMDTHRDLHFAEVVDISEAVRSGFDEAPAHRCTRHEERPVPPAHRATGWRKRSRAPACESMIELVRRNQRNVSTEPSQVQAGLVHGCRTAFPPVLRACWAGAERRH
jgi:hypothetical protein